MKKTSEHRTNDNGLRQEYDFASMPGGIRGKHYDAYRKGSNVVLLDPDVARAFPTEDAVNEALRGIFKSTRGVRQAGGLQEHKAQPQSRGRRRG